MLSKLFISLLAATMTFASPLLHYWEHRVDVTAQAVTSGCDCHDAVQSETPDAPEQPSDDRQTCDCSYRVAVPQSHPCDIAELAVQALPGDYLLAANSALDSNSKFSPRWCSESPVHFLPAADGGDLCARLGRHLL
jgi:hypothetical protein